MNAWNNMVLSENISITPHLIMLERNTDELILLNYNENNPLYISRGKQFIINLINEIKVIKNIQQIYDRYPNDTELIKTMMDYKIIISEKEIKKRSNCSLCSDNCTEYVQNNYCRNGFSLYLLLTQYCNLECIYCYNGSEGYQKQKHLKMNEAVGIKTLEKYISILNPGKSCEIVFFGGEPLLNWELIKKLILKCENELRIKLPNREWYYHLTSNLFYIPPDLIEWSKKYNISFLCDIDGPPNYHNALRPAKNGKNSYQKIVDNIKKLIDNGLTISLRSTITSLNVDAMQEIAETHKNIGGNGCSFVPLSPVNSDEIILPAEWCPDPHKFVNNLKKVIESGIWELDEIFPINEMLKKLMNNGLTNIACGAPAGNTPVIDVHGDIYPCIYWVGIKRLKLGNILSEGLEIKKEILTYLSDNLNVDKMTQCKKCEWRYICGGGCPVHRISVKNNPRCSEQIKRYADDITCILNKELIPFLLWKLADRIKGNLNLSHIICN